MVMTDVGQGPDILRRADAGIVVPRRSPERLAEAVCALLGDRERAAAMGARGRAMVEAELSGERMVDRMAELVDGLARSS